MTLAAASAGCPPGGSFSAVSELMAQGRESAAVLDALLQGASPPPHGGVRELAAEILRCCDRALAALHCGADAGAAGGGRKRKSVGGGGATTQTRPKRRTRASGGETPARVEKKRTAEDGFMWRKYGQKDINNSKYPRLYFRCTYKHYSGCPATRQVQQSEDDPSLYVITYFGDHTCCGDAAAVGVDGEMQPFVINFLSATASSGSPWLSSSDELPVKATKVESTTTTSDSQPAAEPSSSSADVSCVSPAAFDTLPGCLDWDYFGESSFDDISEFFNFDEISLFQ